MLTTTDIPIFTGGVLVFADNSLLYLNQSVPPYGVSLNGIAEQWSSFPLRKLIYLRFQFQMHRLYISYCVVDCNQVKSVHVQKASAHSFAYTSMQRKC